MRDHRGMHSSVIRARLYASCLLAVGAGASLSAQGVEPPSYTEVAEWPVPATSAAGTAVAWNFGQVAAVATDADGAIVVLHRGAHPLMVFNPTGQFLRSWGDGVISEGKVVRISPEDRVRGGSGYTAVYGPAGCYACGAHSVRVDPEGNTWVVDAGAHVVYKVNTEGRVLIQLGTDGVAGAGTDTFNLPTDVAFAPNGDVYVSDGYGNARVVKYTSDGRYLLQWGERGKGPGEFGLPHNLVVDAEGRVYVTDRDNLRIQIFDAYGVFLEEWTDVGSVSALAMTGDQQIWSGGTLRSLEGDVVARLSRGEGGHGAAVSRAGDVFVAQLSGRVQKFVSTVVP